MPVIGPLPHEHPAHDPHGHEEEFPTGNPFPGETQYGAPVTPYSGEWNPFGVRDPYGSPNVTPYYGPYGQSPILRPPQVPLR
jgi:hypothetical protein